MRQVIAKAAYKHAAVIYAILSHPTALHILTVLDQQQNIGTCPAPFFITEGISLSAVTCQLKRLIDIKAITKETLENKVYYKLSNGRIETINGAAARLL